MGDLRNTPPLHISYDAPMKQAVAQVRWERHTQRPLFGLALVFAVAYAVPIVDPRRES